MRHGKCTVCSKPASVICWSRFFCSQGCIDTWNPHGDDPGRPIPVPLAVGVLPDEIDAQIETLKAERADLSRTSGGIAGLAITRHHARKAYEEARADWLTLAGIHRPFRAATTLMATAWSVYQEADRELNERIAQMLIDGKRLAAEAQE